MIKAKLYIAVSALSVIGYAWLAWNIVYVSDDQPVFHACLVREVTGIPCPSCGTTRALVQIAHGGIMESLFLNPMGILLAIALLVVPTWILVDTLWKRESFLRFYRSGEQFFATHRWISSVAVGMVVLNWVWNVLKGY